MYEPLQCGDLCQRQFARSEPTALCARTAETHGMMCLPIHMALNPPAYIFPANPSPTSVLVALPRRRWVAERSAEGAARSSA